MQLGQQQQEDEQLAEFDKLPGVLWKRVFCSLSMGNHLLKVSWGVVVALAALTFAPASLKKPFPVVLEDK